MEGHLWIGTGNHIVKNNQRKVLINREKRNGSATKQKKEWEWMITEMHIWLHTTQYTDTVCLRLPNPLAHCFVLTLGHKGKLVVRRGAEKGCSEGNTQHNNFCS